MSEEITSTTAAIVDSAKLLASEEEKQLENQASKEPV